MAANDKGNVIEFAPRAKKARYQMRDDDLIVADYLKKLNTAMELKSGLSYMSCRTALHGNTLDAVRSFRDRGVAPEDAAEQIMRDNNLKALSPEISKEFAVGYNTIQVKLAEIANTEDFLHRSNDGRLFMEMQGAIAFVGAAHCKKYSHMGEHSFGFGIQVHEGANAYGAEIVNEGAPSHFMAGWEFSDVYEKFSEYEHERKQTSAFKFM